LLTGQTTTAEFLPFLISGLLAIILPHRLHVLPMSAVQIGTNGDSTIQVQGWIDGEREGTMIRKLITIVVLSLGFCWFPTRPSSQTAMASNDRGRKLYLQYCASCHGVDARGNGPVAPNLRKPPPDLTQIEKKEGKFPGPRIRNVIAGEIGTTEISVHGTREMPVWGKVFRVKEVDKSVATLDFYVLTKYVESIQQK